MDNIVNCIEEIKERYQKYKERALNEASTRMVFINPLLECLGWDTSNLDEVEPEYSTIDKKEVDYACKVDNKPVLLIEAKSLNSTLDDPKGITQIIGYAASEGVNWCVLSNGIVYKVYSSTEKIEATKKLLFEVDLLRLEPKLAAEKLNNISKNFITNGMLDELSEQLFTEKKVTGSLKEIFLNPSPSFIKLIKNTSEDNSLDNTRIKKVLSTLWRDRLSVASEGKIGKTAHSKVISSKLEKTTKDANKESREISKDRKAAKKITGFAFQGKRYDVATWTDTLVKFCELLQESHQDFYSTASQIKGKKRDYFSKDNSQMHSPRLIRGSNIFVETNLSAEFIQKLIKRLLVKFGYSDDSVEYFCNQV